MSLDDSLIESRSLRESKVKHTEVLDKVKGLAMLPDDVHVTVQMAADYYEVGKKVIEKLIERHKNELLSNGLKIISGEDLKKFVTDNMSMTDIVSPKTRFLTIIPRRAILNIGMLLRDSEVAKKIRIYLLDSEDEKQKGINKKKLEIELTRAKAELNNSIAELTNSQVRKARQCEIMVRKHPNELTGHAKSNLIVVALAALTGKDTAKQELQIRNKSGNVSNNAKYYTAATIARLLGTSWQKVGWVSSSNHVKTDYYGHWRFDYSSGYNKFYYNEEGKNRLISLMSLDK